MSDVDMVEMIVVEDLVNSEFQPKASEEPQEVPAAAVEKHPAKFAKTPAEAKKKIKALAAVKEESDLQLDAARRKAAAEVAQAEAEAATAKAEEAASEATS